MTRKRETDNLDKDTARAMALGYGVHYGRYKADYPNTADEIPEEPKKLKYTKICLNCGMEFHPNRSDRKYCCEECRWEYTHKHRRKRPEMRRRETCKLCGKVITKPRMRSYCSLDCSIAAKKIQDKDKHRRLQK